MRLFQGISQLDRRNAVFRHDEQMGISILGVHGAEHFSERHGWNIDASVLPHTQNIVQGCVNKREKFRIRYYGTDTSFIRLEKKSKINGLCNKVTCRISAEKCQKIIDGDIEFMKDSEHELMRELYSKMKYQLLRPKCIVAYTRECFVYPPGNVRVTLDMNICGSNNVKEFLNPDLQFLQTYHNSILEVKWDEYLPQIIRDLVQVKSRRSAAFSKYAAIRI